MLIRLENVYKSYRMGSVDLMVLRGVDLEVEAGSFVSILGPSGSGKSTLLHIMSCLDAPTKGKVFLEDQDVSGFKQDRLAEIRGQKIGFVFQQFNLLSNLNALDNVSIPLLFRGIPENVGQARARSLLDALELGRRLMHRPTEMSGGEQQRVALARALINDPDIIVADEPTGNVDSRTGKKIMDIFTDFNQRGKTVVIVTHDINIAHYGQEIVEIKDGQIIDRRPAN